MWEQFPEETRHPHPLYSAGTLKIIAPVWTSRGGRTDKAKSEKWNCMGKINIQRGFDVQTCRCKSACDSLPSVFFRTAAINKDMSHAHTRAAHLTYINKAKKKKSEVEEQMRWDGTDLSSNVVQFIWKQYLAVCLCDLSFQESLSVHSQHGAVSLNMISVIVSRAGALWPRHL